MRIFYPITLMLVAFLGLFSAAYADDGSLMDYEAQLSGVYVVPTPVNTVTTGKAKFEAYLTRIEFDLDIEGATAILGAGGAHIHCAPAGQTGPVVAYLAGEIPGGFNGEVDIQGSLTQANIVDATCGSTIPELVQSMAAGNTYVNVHSLANPNGEIRGQIQIDIDD